VCSGTTAPLKMKTKEIAKTKVIKALLSNLFSLAKDIDWSIEHRLVKRYITCMDEPHRVYHGWEHIHSMLKEMDELHPSLVRDPIRLRSGILFHDIVCIPGAKDNEEKSSQLASPFYRAKDIGVVESLIMATKHVLPFEHFGDDRDLICDLDLASLGAGRDVFMQNRMKIAQEYRGYCTPIEFDIGTRTFFLYMLRQAEYGGIFRTEWFRSRYENNAKENMEMMISRENI